MSCWAGREGVRTRRKDEEDMEEEERREWRRRREISIRNIEAIPMIQIRGPPFSGLRRPMPLGRSITIEKQRERRVDDNDE